MGDRRRRSCRDAIVAAMQATDFQANPEVFNGQVDSLWFFLPGIPVAPLFVMLKLLGSYALAKLLGFGLIGAIVIYALLSLLT